MKINPAKFVKGEINLPGDKSISHRAAMFSALAEGETVIENFATSADCASTISCLQTLGVEISRNNSRITVRGAGTKGLRKPLENLDCGNSGTTMRLLSGILAGQDFESTLTGDESLSLRPMKRVIEPLTEMGAKINSTDFHAPLVISGTTELKGQNFTTKIASAQLKSCLLLAGLFAGNETSVLEKTPTRDHTERMLRFLGADIRQEQTHEGNLISISGASKLSAKNLDVPSDISSAAFFLVAAACLENSEITLNNVGLNPSRIGIIEVLKNFGANIEIANERESCNEPIADLKVYGTKILSPKTKSNSVSGEIIANLIDEIPILAVFGTQIEGGIEIRNAEELRVKESDRITSVVENLRRMNAAVEEFPDGLRVGKSNLRGANLESYGDHRIAMAFAVAALFAEGETEISGAECAAVSFPEFFGVLKSITGQ